MLDDRAPGRDLDHVHAEAADLEPSAREDPPAPPEPSSVSNSAACLISYEFAIRLPSEGAATYPAGGRLN